MGTGSFDSQTTEESKLYKNSLGALHPHQGPSSVSLVVLHCIDEDSKGQMLKMLEILE